MPTWAISSEDLHLLGPRLDFLDDGRDAEIDAALQIHRVHAGGDQLGALAQDGGGKHRRRRGAVAGKIVGLGGHFAHHLRAHVLELVGELDFLGDGHAVLGDARRAIGLVDDDVAALGAERHLDGIVQQFDAAQHAVARIGGEFDFLGRHDVSSSSVLRCGIGESGQAAFLVAASVFSTMPMMSASFMIRRSSPSILTSVPDHLPNRIEIARLDVERDQLAAFVARARADGDHLAFLRLFLRGVGNDDPAFGFDIAFRASDDDAVVEWPEFHEVLSAVGA